MKKPAMIILIAVASLAFAAPAPAQVWVPGEPAPPLLEVAEDGTLIYGGDVAIACGQVGSGVVAPAANSSPETRAELERTNERAVQLCAEAGFPPPGTDGEVLPDTGGASLVALALAAIAACLFLMRGAVR